MSLANMEEEARIRKLTCAWRAISGRAETPAQGKIHPWDSRCEVSSPQESRFSIDFPAVPDSPTSGNATETQECARKDGENRLLKSHPEAYVFLVNMHPFRFFASAFPRPSHLPLHPPPLTTPCAWSPGPRDTLRLYVRLLTVASIKIQSADSFFIYSSLCLRRINEEAD